MQTNKAKISNIGFTCAYTPLAIIDAAGFSPRRILPIGDHPDVAGQHLHDNICPHVKKTLDIALSGALPKIAGMVFVNSCDAMRRLADAWRHLRPDDRILLLDLPATPDDLSVKFFASELKRMADAISEWRGISVSENDIASSAGRFNEICGLLGKVTGKLRSRKLEGGAARIQEIYNFASASSFSESVAELERINREPALNQPGGDGAPVFLFGNVMPDPKAFELFESCGIRIVGDDFCTGSRMFRPALFEGAEENIYLSLAKGILRRPPCGRTFHPENPGSIADDIIAGAKKCGAEAVIGHTLKFCDPYLDRLPTIRNRTREEKIPILVLEGDCSLRSVEQQRTRIEAFVEMLR